MEKEYIFSDEVREIQDAIAQRQGRHILYTSILRSRDLTVAADFYSKNRNIYIAGSRKTEIGNSEEVIFCIFDRDVAEARQYGGEKTTQGRAHIKSLLAKNYIQIATLRVQLKTSSPLRSNS